jgi:putative two-component system response regulator
MERHAEVGHEMLAGSDSDVLRLAATIALTHHERLDGTGYPNGVRGTDIPLEGRIVAVADVFDALTSERVYKRAMSVMEAVEVIRQGRGTQFDPEVVDAFLDILDEVVAVQRRHADEPVPAKVRTLHVLEAS